MTLESWKQTWQRGLTPHISTEGLEALRKALVVDDPRLVQKTTTVPTPLLCNASCEVTGACAASYPFWIGDGLETVEEVETAFAQVCYACDQEMGEPGAVRWFLNAFDSWTRDEMRRNLMIEVQRSLAERYSAENAVTQ